ncbi:hypothetical protein AAW14_20070 [Streptomyces hygroscopicus]|uniref:DUF4232 domain-containing protein n=1 Tax=Streptomyces hygroscopicus TaxID=1912 RepID=UPI0022403C92|nr:DUF4232 domain-containing protein [Streptomyces hygroscopicus]MCW7944277.1 hypothetical protein [Streptomyces hygroscopicus]
MNHRLRTTLMATVALGAGLLMTACQSNATSGALSAVTGSRGSTPEAGQGTAEEAGKHSGSGASSPSGASGGPGAPGDGASARGAAGSTAGGGAPDNKVGQRCGADDILWSTRSETQTTGYILITAKARPGITCTLPGGSPLVAFGSDGTMAKPVEQAQDAPITLRAGVTVYAGVKPKTTDSAWGKELDEIIVAVDNDDDTPVSLKVGRIVVDHPSVTNWHTSPSQAVPSSS